MFEPSPSRPSADRQPGRRRRVGGEALPDAADEQHEDDDRGGLEEDRSDLAGAQEELAGEEVLLGLDPDPADGRDERQEVADLGQDDAAEERLQVPPRTRSFTL